MTPPVLLWFRHDLRLNDNPALTAALRSGRPILPIYILDDEVAGAWKMGSASRVWLHHSLASLNKSLSGKLSLFKGSADQILPQLCQQTRSPAVFWNRLYEPWRHHQDQHIEKSLTANGVQISTFKASLLYEPWEVLKEDGTPYRVFTPYFRRGCLSKPGPRLPLPRPNLIPLAETPQSSVPLDQLLLLPKTLKWGDGMVSHWEIGESGAQQALASFLATGLKNYKNGRDYPALPHPSRLSPYLHFGEISPNQIWHDSKNYALINHLENDLDHFHSELAWREFSHSLLHFNPTLPDAPLNKKFDLFDWAEPTAEALERWQKGLTGFPIVDAGLRELWATGYMHNRVRMIVGSFLVKDLRFHWRVGEDWFWETLFDANLANNAASWQWVAGCGADAAPYFRIFNPHTQAEKFDPKQEYIRKWIPEWGTKRYPAPMLDHKTARDQALEAFQRTRS